MSWEYRRGRFGPYYTRTRREGGRRVREYVGGGIRGQYVEILDEQEREKREVVLNADRQRRAKLANLDAALAALSKIADTITAATLGQAGCYRHHRGEWRKRAQVDRA